MRILENNRLLLKPVEQEDLPFLLNLRWENDIMKYLIHEPLSLKNQQIWFENITKSGDLPFSIFIKDEKNKPTIVGTVGLSNFNYRHQRATWKYLRIAPDYQRKGIAFESSYMVFDYGFNTLNLNKIVGDSFVDNIAINNLSKKLGFVEEGILRSHFFHDGEFKDVISWGVIRTNFNSVKLGPLSPIRETTQKKT